MVIGDSAAPRVVWFPKQEDPEMERIHAAAAAGEYRRYAGPERPCESLARSEYVQLRWPGHAHLDLADNRDPRRQIPHARRAIERARAKAGLFADLQESGPRPSSGSRRSGRTPSGRAPGSEATVRAS